MTGQNKQSPVKLTYLIKVHAAQEMPACWTNWNTTHNLSHSVCQLVSFNNIEREKKSKGTKCEKKKASGGWEKKTKQKQAKCLVQVVAQGGKKQVKNLCPTPPTSAKPENLVANSIVINIKIFTRHLCLTLKFTPGERKARRKCKKKISSLLVPGNISFPVSKLIELIHLIRISLIVFTQEQEERPGYQ